MLQGVNLINPIKNARSLSEVLNYSLEIQLNTWFISLISRKFEFICTLDFDERYFISLG